MNLKNMENKTIITPINKSSLLLKGWITGEEYENIQSPITDIRMVIDTVGVGKGDINVGEAVKKSTERAIETVVVSIDGDTKDILAKIRKMHKDDYLFVLKEVDLVVKGEGFTQP